MKSKKFLYQQIMETIAQSVIGFIESLDWTLNESHDSEADDFIAGVTNELKEAFNLNEMAVSADVKLPKFNKEEFLKDFEAWKTKNHLNVMGYPQKPIKPKMKEFIDLKNIPIQPPVKPNLPKLPKYPTSPKKPKEPEYKRLIWLFTPELIPNKKKEYGGSIPDDFYEKFKKIYRYEKIYDIVRDFIYAPHTSKFRTESPHAYQKLVNNFIEKLKSTNLYFVKEDNKIKDEYVEILLKFKKELDDYINLIDTHTEEEFREIFKDKIQGKTYSDYEYAIKRYERKKEERRKECERIMKSEYGPKIREYQKELEEYKKKVKEYVLKNQSGKYASIDAYEDALQIWRDNMYQYEEQMKKWGPERELTIDDFLLISYVYPEIEDTTIYLKDGTEYVLPKYIRGVRLEDLVNVNMWGDHLEKYREFLRMNPSISKEYPDQKYSIRVNNNSGWNIQKFIRAWVLNYYTDLYEDIEIIEY